MSWGNATGDQYGQDMVGPDGRHLFATEDSATDPAIKGHNLNSSGLAIHSDGPLKVDGEVSVLQKITVGIGTAGYLDSGQNRELSINASAGSTHIYMGKNDGSADTLVNGTLHADTLWPRSGADLYLANSNGNSVHIGDSIGANSITTIESKLLCDKAVEIDGAVDLDNTFDQDANTSGTAMDVNNTNQTGTAVAIKATGPIALHAIGKVVLASGERLILDGTTGDNFITYSSANSRIEFYVGGSLHFYIDDHGGHSV